MRNSKSVFGRIHQQYSQPRSHQLIGQGCGGASRDNWTIRYLNIEREFDQRRHPTLESWDGKGAFVPIRRPIGNDDQDGRAHLMCRSRKRKRVHRPCIRFPGCLRDSAQISLINCSHDDWTPIHLVIVEWLLFVVVPKTIVFTLLHRCTMTTRKGA